MMTATVPSSGPKNDKAMSTAQMLGLVGEIGYMVAVPAFVFGFSGAYLDKYFATSPWLTIAGLAVAIVSSGLAIWHRIKPFLNS